jgi:hypothetical protein
MLPLLRSKPGVRNSVPGGKVVFLADSIGDPFVPQGGITQGAFRAPVATAFGWTIVGAGLNANDMGRSGIQGRMVSNVLGQVLAAQNAYVQCALTYLPDVVVLGPLGTNDWVQANVTVTPTTLASAFDVIIPALKANVAVKSVQQIVPSAQITAGTYTLTQGGNTTAAIAFNAILSTVNTRLGAATPAAIPFTASTAISDPPLSNVVPNSLILTANTTGAKTAFTVTPTGITGGTLAVSGGLGGTPNVQLVVMTTFREYTIPPTGAGVVPPWATSNLDTTWQLLTVIKDKAWQYGCALAHVERMPGVPPYTVSSGDPTHLDALGATYYQRAIINAVMGTE